MLFRNCLMIVKQYLEHGNCNQHRRTAIGEVHNIRAQTQAAQGDKRGEGTSRETGREAETDRKIAKTNSAVDSPAMVRTQYEEKVRTSAFQTIEALQDSMRTLFEHMSRITHARAM